jgi:hypothetical protein
MQVPRLTGEPALDVLLLLVAVVAFGYVAKYAILSRGHLRKVACYAFVGFIIGTVLGHSPQMPKGRSPYACGVFCGVVAAALVRAKSRSRHIPARIKREVIARDFKGREDEYDSRKHHIDHKWAFARGGGNTHDNLRVIDKKKNLKKGAKRPGLIDMFFR